MVTLRRQLEVHKTRARGRCSRGASRSGWPRTPRPPWTSPPRRGGSPPLHMRQFTPLHRPTDICDSLPSPPPKSPVSRTNAARAPPVPRGAAGRAGAARGHAPLQPRQAPHGAPRRTLCTPLSLSLYISVSLCTSLSLFVHISFSLYISVSLRLPLPLSLSFSLPLSLCYPVTAVDRKNSAS